VWSCVWLYNVRSALYMACRSNVPMYGTYSVTIAQILNGDESGHDCDEWENCAYTCGARKTRVPCRTAVFSMLCAIKAALLGSYVRWQRTNGHNTGLVIRQNSRQWNLRATGTVG
jgi:hypothetical protein